MLRLHRHGRSGLFMTGVSAVDCALWDLEAKLAGRSAWELAGLEPRTVVTDYSLSLDTPEEMHRRALRYRDWPFLKIKLGGGPVDIERVTAVRDAAPRARFTVDANESWTIAQLERDGPKLKALGVDWSDPKFWQGGFDVLEKLVSELEKLPVAKKAKAKPAAKKALKKVVAKKSVKAKTAKKKSKK